MWRVPISVGLWIRRGPNWIGLELGSAVVSKSIGLGLGLLGLVNGSSPITFIFVFLFFSFSSFFFSFLSGPSP
jgi:hypothetical protein